MPNTYTQIYLQFVFVVKYRNAVIESSWKDELYMYITGIVTKNNHKVIIINGVADHVHLLVGMRPNQSVSDLLQDIKSNSAKWINDRKLTKSKFEWQSGFGAFSYHESMLDRIVNYIRNQEAHHQKKTFKAEYIEFLEKFHVDYNEKYIFKELE